MLIQSSNYIKLFFKKKKEDFHKIRKIIIKNPDKTTMVIIIEEIHIKKINKIINLIGWEGKIEVKIFKNNKKIRF